MTPLDTFGLPSTVAKPILLLAAEIIKQAATIGPGRWGLTPRPFGFRLNVGWTEILTIYQDHLQLIICREQMPDRFPKGVTFYSSKEGGDYYPSVPDSIMAKIPYSLSGRIVSVIRVLRQSLSEAVALAGRRRSGISVKKGHKQAVVERLAAAIGKKLPSPQYEISDDEVETGSGNGEEFQSSDEVSAHLTYTEGATMQVLVNAYERNATARSVCIAEHGTACAVCDFDFGKVYGEIGEGFTHVHHLRDLATIGEEYEVDPKREMRPVCPNCHAMLHREVPAMSIRKLKALMRK